MTLHEFSKDRASDSFAPFLQRVSRMVQLHQAEEDLVRGLAASTHSVKAGAAISRGADGSALPWIVAHGWACRARVLCDGRQQIFSFIIPGDTIGVFDGPCDHAGTEVVALADLVLLDAQKLKQLVRDPEQPYPNLRQACASERRLEERRLLDQVVRLGRLSSYERTAHLLLEFYQRLNIAGLATGTTFPFPLTQTQLGDALGLSLVHVNRTLQRLRHEGLLTLRAGTAILNDLRGLELVTNGQAAASVRQERVHGAAGGF